MKTRTWKSNGMFGIPKGIYVVECGCTIKQGPLFSKGYCGIDYNYPWNGPYDITCEVCDYYPFIFLPKEK